MTRRRLPSGEYAGSRMPERVAGVCAEKAATARTVMLAIASAER